MMIIGSKATFAIEFDVNNIQSSDPEVTPQQAYFVFGHLCYWIHHYQIGDYEIGGSLSAATAGFKGLLCYKGKRHMPSLWNKPANEVFKVIDDALYLDIGQSDEQVRLDSETYSKLMAIPHGVDVFDNWKAYLIQGTTIARFIWKYREEVTAREAILDINEFDLRIQEFIDWFERSYSVL